VIHDLMQALGFDRFRIHVNNRLVLNGLLEEMGLSEQTAPLLRVLDKLSKIGRDAVRAEMAEKTGTDATAADRVLTLVEMTGTNAAILDHLQREYGQNAKAVEGIRRLRELIEVVAAAGAAPEKVRLDL